MGVYIKGMEMPNNCHECELVDILLTCPCRKMADDDFWNNVSLAVEGHKDCPLVEVPTPHGRLIDEEAVIDHFVSLSNNEWNQNVSTSWANAFAEAASDICDIPTIIEAEGA